MDNDAQNVPSQHSSRHVQKKTAPADLSKRRFLARLTSILGGIGLIGAAIPFLAAWRPSERAKALGGPVKVDLADLAPGQRKTVEWRGKPVWIIRRTDEMINSLSTDEAELRDPTSEESQQPRYAMNRFRSVNKEYLVLIGVCTHLGCTPTYRPSPGELGAAWPGGFFCPCHGSTFDLAGRVFKGVPAPINLQVPPYRFASATQMIIGEDTKA